MPLTGFAEAPESFPNSLVGRAVDPSLAFLARCLGLLDEGGVLGIVLPDGIIDGPEVRSALLHGGNQPLPYAVEASISLPRATFAPAGTAAKTSAVFLRRGPAKTRTVVLARADHVGFLWRGGVVTPDPGGNDMPAIGRLASLAARPDQPATTVLSDAPLVARVSRAALASLDPSMIDPKAIAARAALRILDGSTLGSFITPTKRCSRQTLGNVPFVSVLHVDDLSCVDWLEAETYRPATPGIIARPGELLVSLLNPAKLRATVIPARYGPVYCSPEFGVFATPVDPYGVLAILQDPRVRAQLAPLGRGTSSSRRRITPADVCGLQIPPVDEEWLAGHGARVRRALEDHDQARRALVRAYGNTLSLATFATTPIVSTP